MNRGSLRIVSSENSTSVLLVEDDPAMNRAIQAALVSNGYDVRAAESVASGLELAMDKIPSVLVLDVELPDGTGWDLLREIRKTYPQEQIKVIVVSSTRVSRMKLREEYVSTFVPKPFDMLYFLQTVREVIDSD